MAMPTINDHASTSSGSDNTVNGRTTPPAIKTAGGAYPLAPGHPLWEDLAPADSYTQDGTYWADLSRGSRTAWINKQSNDEARRELKVLGSMFKADPLSPLAAYWKRYVITGFGVSSCMGRKHRQLLKKSLHSFSRRVTPCSVSAT